MNTKKQLSKMKIGEIKDVIFSNGILRSTKEVEKIDGNKYLIHSFSSGWETTTLSQKEAIKFIEGKICLTELNWK